MYKGKLFLFCVLLCSSVFSHAAINAQYNFEDGVPKFVSAGGGGSVSQSTERYKDGNSSLKFDWAGDSELVFSNFLEIESSMKVPGAGVMVWVYNPSPAEGAVLRFAFRNWSGGEICHFDFALNFRGWRTAWIKYVDMHTADGYYGDINASERSTAVSKMTLTPVGVEEGTLYIDRLSFSKTKLHDQITPDMQIPDNNHNLSRRNMWHWCRLYEWEQNPPLTVSPISQAQKTMLDDVAGRLDKVLAAELSSSNYVAGTLLKRADDMYAKYKLQRLPDRTVSGAPLLSDDEFNNSLGEMRIRFIGQIIYWYAQDYYYTGNKSNLDKIFVTMDHAIEQGFAFGSGQGTNHHYGYQIRELYKGMWLLRKEIAAAGKTDEYVKVLEYWAGLAETRLPFVYGRDEILDSWHTLNEAKIISAMMTSGEEERYAKMAALAQWLSGSMSYSPGTLGGIKVDGTSFHHGGLYPAYSVGAFAAIGEWCNLVKGTDFVPTESARKCMKHAFLTMRNYCNLTDWGLTVCGRHPFSGFIPKADIEAFASLALLGDLTGSGMSADPDLGGAYLYLGGGNSDSVSTLKKAGITASAAPEGFFVMNYGALGVHRRGNWMLSLKAFNTDVWGSEIYTADNRYGRYQSYGSAILIGSGKPVSEKSSGFVQEGWDWNRVPGTTTIHLPYDLLENPLNGTLMERNTSRFPGASSLEGRNGVLAFTYVEGDRKNFCPGATATKSVFCFDNRIVFLGSGITNNSTYPTETTLYQLALESRDEEIDINEDYFSDFPLHQTYYGSGPAVITDTKGNTYIIRDGKGLNVVKQQQTSPSDTKKTTGTGDFATAYIDHGVSPSNASYEYLLLVKPAGKEVSKYSKKLPYTVIRQDNAAHVVADHTTGITAYICYADYDAAQSQDGLARLAKEKEAKQALPIESISGETIVMERTREDGTVVMSVCTPDLGITEKSYTTPQPSQPLIRTVVIEGNYSLAEASDKVSVSSQNGKTVVSATCIDGLPTEFTLSK